MAASKGTAAAGGPQSIEQLQKRYLELYGKKERAEANLDTAKSDLEKQQKHAREEYGTHDVAELRKMLEDRRVENENKRQDYQAELDRIENELTAVEQKFAAAENPLASDAPRT